MELEQIILDRRSGQSRIIKMTLELLKRVRRKSERVDICKKVCSAHRVMAGLFWILKMVEEGRSVSEIEMEIEEMERKCVERVSEISKDKVVLTMSRSHVVERGVMGARHVIVLESSPSKEGVEMARYLKGRGVSVTVFPDSAVSYALKACDLVVVGADAVMKDGFINKTGTLPLALAARHLGKEFYVASPKYKFFEVKFEEKVDLSFSDDMLFELIPSELVKEFLVE